MSISKKFGSGLLYRPGAYSQSITTPDASSGNNATGILLILGEADAGMSGAAEGLQQFSAAAFNQMAQKYKSGPILDAAKAAIAPSRTPGINGASTFYVWKTNSSSAASLSLANAYDTLSAAEYGIGGNRITYRNTLSSESAIAVTGSSPITNFAGLDTETLIVDQNGASPLTVTFATPTNIAGVLSQINAALPGIIATATASTLTLTMSAALNHNRDGSGRSMEIVGGTALANLFLTVGVTLPVSEPQASLELIQPRDQITETAIVGGSVDLMIGRNATGGCTSASVTINATSIILTQTGATPSTITLSIVNYPLIGNVVDAINNLAGFSATLASASLRYQPTSTLDQVTVGAFSASNAKPARIKRDANNIKAFYADSQLVTAAGTAVKGLPDQEGRLNLLNGTRGASASSDFDAGLSAAMAVDINVALPCISQDAAFDITAGLTDPASSYDIETVHAILATQLILRGNLQNKKEAQGFVGYRVPLKANAFNQAAAIGSSLVQLVMEDTLVVDASNNLTWKQPHIFAALLAGIRLGSDIGEPLTHKYLNCQGMGHFVNPSTGVATGNYNPQIDYQAAIIAGVTSSEPASGSFRVMLDNTTYGADSNFVFNRGSVVEAAQYIAKTIRSDADINFVGKKNAVVTASSIKARVSSLLISLFNAQITSPSDDAPQGYVPSSLIVSIVGNTASVSVQVKPVQSLDFILITFTLGETRQSA